jgi:hypothetical protein
MHGAFASVGEYQRSSHLLFISRPIDLDEHIGDLHTCITGVSLQCFFEHRIVLYLNCFSIRHRSVRASSLRMNYALTFF